MEPIIKDKCDSSDPWANLAIHDYKQYLIDNYITLFIILILETIIITMLFDHSENNRNILITCAVIPPAIYAGLFLWATLKSFGQICKFGTRKITEKLNNGTQKTAPELTKIHNYDNFCANISSNKFKMIGLGQKFKMLGGTMLVFELDYCKEISDEFGADVKQVALAHIRKSLRECTSDKFILGQMNDHQFAIFLPAIDEHEVIYSIFSNIQEYLVKHPLTLATSSMTLTLSAGASICAQNTQFNPKYKELQDILRQAIAHGGNQLALYDLENDKIEMKCAKPTHALKLMNCVAYKKETQKSDTSFLDNIESDNDKSELTLEHFLKHNKLGISA